MRLMAGTVKPMTKRATAELPSPSRIVVRCPNWLGDLVMAVPALRALREGFPEAGITLLVKPHLMAVLAGAPWYDRIRPLEIYGDYHRWGRMGRAAAALRGERFDLGVVLPNSFSAAWIFHRAGVPRILGYARNWRRFLLTDRVSAPRKWGAAVPVPMQRYYLDLVSRLGCAVDRTDLVLFVTAEERTTMEKRLREMGLSDTRPLVAIAPGASFGASKMWPPARFARAADAILEKHGGAALLLPGPGEEPAARAVAAAMRGRAEVCWPPVSLGPLKAALEMCTVLLTNDSGARHVAEALRVPQVVVMGPTDRRYGAMSENYARVVRRDVRCGPCHLKVCPLDHRCMKLIQPEEVAAAAEAALGAGAER